MSNTDMFRPDAQATEMSKVKGATSGTPGISPDANTPDPMGQKNSPGDVKVVTKDHPWLA